jgi:hypothetical protein
VSPQPRLRQGVAVLLIATIYVCVAIFRSLVIERRTIDYGIRAAIGLLVVLGILCLLLRKSRKG